MTLSRARLRYLNAIGVALPSIAIAACGKSTTTTADAGGEMAVNMGPESPGPCPPPAHYCLPAPAAGSDAGAMAPAPYDRCSKTATAPGVPPRGGNAFGTFDAEKTATERATQASACCYAFQRFCGKGRPFRDADGVAAVAALVERGDWLGVIAHLDTLVDGLTPPDRAVLADHWTRDALLEHASIASFAQLTLDLMALAAPPELIEGAQRAAIDEIRHARIAFAVASAYAGRTLGPSALAVPPRSPATLEALACSTFNDGCVGESLAAAALREASAQAKHPTLRAVLDEMAEDEERHAELAWRIVAWARSSGDRGVARALHEATAMFALDAASQGALHAQVFEEIVAPCAAALQAMYGAT